MFGMWSGVVGCDGFEYFVCEFYGVGGEVVVEDVEVVFCGDEDVIVVIVGVVDV